jgi:hypothetical protein
MISGGQLKDFKSLPVPAPFSPLERDNRVDTGRPSHRWAPKAECPRFPPVTTEPYTGVKAMNTTWFESRLMHGTGIRAMGHLMDRMVSAFHPREPDLRRHLERELRRVAPVCRWTAGCWEELDLDWRVIQNVPRHLRLFSSLLVRAYLQAQGGGP